MKRKSIMKCIVYGCENHDHQGEFINEMCLPCYNIITTGELKPTSSFLKRLNDGIYGFYEDEYPHYASYKNAHSELSYLVYPEEVNRLVDRIKELEAKKG